MYDEETAVNIVNLVKEKYIIEFNKLKDFFRVLIIFYYKYYNNIN